MSKAIVIVYSELSVINWKEVRKITESIEKWLMITLEHMKIITEISFILLMKIFLMSIFKLWEAANGMEI